MKGQPRANLWRTIAAILCLLLAGMGVAAAKAPATDPAPAPAVRLHSRQFVPAPGVEAGLAANPRPGAWHGLLQFESPPDPAQRAALAEHDVSLLAYVPRLTWVARLPADLAPVRAVPGVRWIGALRPEDKLDPGLSITLAEGAGAWARQPDGMLALWVSLFPGEGPEQAAAAVAPLGGRVAGRGPQAGPLVIHAPAEAIPVLAGLDGVAWVSLPPAPPVPLNAGVRQNTGAAVVQASPYDLDGAGVRVAIWDAGRIDAHPDFDDRLIIARDSYVDNHATHIAGTVAGSGVNSDQDGNGGTPGQYRGVAPGAQIISYHTYGSPTVEHDEAINTYGADVSQNAWGYGSCSLAGLYDYYARDYDNITAGAYGRGISVVFATGNWGANCGSPYGALMPGGASAKNTITVGNIKHDDNALSNKTAWGPTADGRLKPEIVAPGARTGGGIVSTISGGVYGSYVGSSMSSAAVSGGVALLLEQYRLTCGASGDGAGNPAPASVKALMVHAAQDLANDAELTPGPDFASGYGRADFAAAIDLVPYHLAGTLDHGVIDSYTVVVAHQDQLKFTLAWDDPGAAAYAA